MITIIEKLELADNGEVVNTPIGYTTDVDLINTINEQYDSCLGKFIGENRTKLETGKVLIKSFFETIAFTYEAQINTDSETDLPELTNINQL